MKDGLRTGAEYREALRTDGRQVWVLGGGRVEDVTIHPATAAMVEEYVRWYDRHFDPEWQNIVLTPPDPVTGRRLPLGCVLPKSADDLTAMARCFCATTFPTAGNITHTPAYGQLIALGVLGMPYEQNPDPTQIANAANCRDMIARTGRFLTFSAGAATIGYRLRENPAERAVLKIVRESDKGLVLAGKIGMHTSPVYAEDVYVGSISGVDYQGKRGSFIVPVASRGVTTICRKVSRRHPNPFVSPLSRRFDELDGQMWLDNVLIPWERVFLHDPVPEAVARWLLWHQLYCWLMKAEFTLGLAFALAHAMDLPRN
jgi:aromatic ring hydroxylase